LDQLTMATQPTSPYATLALDYRGAVARLTLRNQPMNVITTAMMAELIAGLEEAEQKAGISVLVLRGSGKGFSAGVDVSAHTPGQVRNMLLSFHSVVRSLVASSKVTVAAVHGNCLGGGAELAAICDLVFTTASAQWGFPEISLGCFPPVAAAVLSAVIGQKRAADLILTGRTISGEQAAAMDLANEAVPEATLEGRVEETCARLSALSPAALQLTKKALYAWDSVHFDKGLARAEKIYLDELMQTHDANEGIEAFMQKRKPEWKGR
jgi:cyclohexa-1,5-dienecarbonyl-CoA hydratase